MHVQAPLGQVLLGYLTRTASLPSGPPPRSTIADPYIPSALIADSPPVVPRLARPLSSLTNARLGDSDRDAFSPQDTLFPNRSTSPTHPLCRLQLIENVRVGALPCGGSGVTGAGQRSRSVVVQAAQVLDVEQLAGADQVRSCRAGAGNRRGPRRRR